MRRFLLGAAFALALSPFAVGPVHAQVANALAVSSCGVQTYTAGQAAPVTQSTTGLPCGNGGGGGVGPAPGPTTPVAGTAHVIVTGGTAVTLVTGPVKGCYIVNPLTATDEGIATVEPAYVNAVTTATTSSLNGSSTALQPGQSWNCPAGQTTNVSGNALTSSHNLVVVVW